MNDYFSKTINESFDNTVQKVTQALKAEGFGILTEFDKKALLKKEQDDHICNYKVLGVCNPLFAFKSLLEEGKIGTILPCNVIIQEKIAGLVEVSTIDPSASVQSIKNKGLHVVATEIRTRLQNAIEQL